jgi:hypothetical protein
LPSGEEIQAALRRFVSEWSDNAVDDGAWAGLVALHKELDEAVVDVEDGRPYDPFGPADGGAASVATPT